MYSKFNKQPVLVFPGPSEGRHEVQAPTLKWARHMLTLKYEERVYAWDDSVGLVGVGWKNDCYALFLSQSIFGKIYFLTDFFHTFSLMFLLQYSPPPHIHTHNQIGSLRYRSESSPLPPPSPRADQIGPLPYQLESLLPVACSRWNCVCFQAIHICTGERTGFLVSRCTSYNAAQRNRPPYIGQRRIPTHHRV